MSQAITNLAKDTKAIAALGYFAAGQTTRTTSVVDSQDYDGVLFELHLGTVTDTTFITFQVKENTANSTSSPTPVAPASAVATLTASGSSNTLLIVDVYRPLLRYLFATVVITTQNVEILGVVARLYGARVKPISQDATVAVAPTLVTGV